MGKRGPKLGSKQLNWTDEERAHIRAELEAYPPGPWPGYGKRGKYVQGRIKRLTPLLPGRSMTQIHNALNRERMILWNLCQRCRRVPVPEGQPSCGDCKTSYKQKRQEWLANGLCGICGLTNLDDDPQSSGTTCRRCHNRRKNYRVKALNQFSLRSKTLRAKTGAKKDSGRIITIPSCGNVKWAATVAGATGRPVCDLFGGSGASMRLVHKVGGYPALYNDIHPGLHQLVNAATTSRPITTVFGKGRVGHPDDLRFQIKERAIQRATLGDTHMDIPVGDHPVDAAVSVLLKHSKVNTKIQSPLSNFTKNMKTLGDILNQHNTSITNRDALQYLRNPSILPKNAILILDPPWPGKQDRYEYKLSKDQQVELVTLLGRLPEDIDFIIMLGASRGALRLATHMRHIPIYWRMTGRGYARSIIGVSPRLPAPSDHRIDLEALGL